MIITKYLGPAISKCVILFSNKWFGAYDCALSVFYFNYEFVLTVIVWFLYLSLTTLLIYNDSSQNPRLNFINVLCTAFTWPYPKSVKKTVKLSICFAPLGSMSVKATRKMLLKLTDDERKIFTSWIKYDQQICFANCKDANNKIHNLWYLMA